MDLAWIALLELRSGDMLWYDFSLTVARELGAYCVDLRAGFEKQRDIISSEQCSPAISEGPGLLLQQTDIERTDGLDFPHN